MRNALQMQHGDDTQQGQRLPYNVEAEAALLGALMIQNRLIDYVLDLKPEHFYDALHGRIFDRVTSLINDGVTASPITLKPYFDDDAAMTELGGVAYLARLTADGSGLIGAKDFAQQIRDLALLREIYVVGQEMSKMALDTSQGANPDKLMDEAQERLHAVATGKSDENKVQSLAEATRAAIAEIEAENRGEGSPALRIKGQEAWNRGTGGMRPGQFIILAGRPAMGKSLEALKIAMGAAEAGYATDFYSLEMSNSDNSMRCLADLAFSNKAESPKAKSVSEMNLTNAEREKVAAALKRMDAMPLTLYRESSLSIAQLTGKIRQSKRRWKAEGKELRLVVVDYIQLMIGDRSRDSSRMNEISSISMAMKQLAEAMDITIIGLSQLSRALEQRDDKRPILSDLRESGSLEQDADIVVFVYREAYYLEAQEPQGPRGGNNKWEEWKADFEAARDQMQLLFRKVRKGATSTQTLFISTEHQAIRDTDWRDEGKFV